MTLERSAPASVAAAICAAALWGCQPDDAPLVSPRDAAAEADSEVPAAAPAAAWDTSVDPENNSNCELVEENGDRETWLCGRNAGEAAIDLDRGNGEIVICWYRVTIIRVGGVIVYHDEELLYCETVDAGGGCGGGGGGEVDDTTTLADCRRGGLNLALKCDPVSPVRGTQVTCNVYNHNPKDTVNLPVLHYTWTVKVNGVLKDPKEEGRGKTTWSGTATSSRSIHVKVGIGEEDSQPWPGERSVVVYNRGWDWSTAENHFYDWDNNASPCTAWGDRWGLVRPVPCGRWFDIEGFSVEQGTGPWGDVSFVSEANAPMTLVALLRPDLHEGGPKHTLANGDTILVKACKKKLGVVVQKVSVWQANKVCTVAMAYQDAIDHVVDHEKRHQDTAKRMVGEHDIYAMWDAFSTMADDPKKAAEEEGKAVDKLIADAQKAVDQVATTRYVFWLFWDGRFQAAGVDLAN